MKKNLEVKNAFSREPMISGQIWDEITEEDFLVGKTPQFFPESWEVDE